MSGYDTEAKREKHRLNQRRYRLRHLTKVRAMEKKYKSKPGAYAKAARRRRALNLHPDRMRARRIVSQAIWRGTLKRPTICSQCGIGCKPDAHHSDYSKPYQIKWLCRICHLKEHGNLVQP